MSTKVYVLSDVIDGKCDQTAGILRSRPGLVTMDVVEGSPHIVFVVEAAERQSLSELTISALASVESMTEGVKLLPTWDGDSTLVNSDPAYTNRTNKARSGAVAEDR